MKTIAKLSILLVCLPAAAQTSGKLDELITPLISSHRGDVCVVVRHLTKGIGFQHQPQKVMPTASLIKLAVMIEAYRQVDQGTLNLETLIDVRKEDHVPGSGILTKHFGSGSKLMLRDAIRLMMAYSDNTATNMVIDQIGLESTARTMSDLGYPETKLHSPVYRGKESIFPERSQKYGLGSTTAADTVSLLERLHKRELVTPDACDEMLNHLKSCESRSQLPRFLPERLGIAHKSGAVSKSRCDAGIIYSVSGPIAICVLTNDNEDRSWTDENAAEVLVGRIARTVFDHFNPPHLAGTTAKSELRMGDFGRRVESLQRTLNARSDPSPDLSIDGDFGPATQAAVIQFQTARQLKPTGVVGTATWKALSPLITERVPVPTPDVVNRQKLPTEPSDELTGRPFVSCRAWAAAEVATGELLGGGRMEQKVDIASTTKVMTAYLVLRKAKTEPAILDEIVTFSRRADRTRGSTSAVEEGESLPVRELLYGLMLPSGNDASVALAEHFGARVSVAGKKRKDTSKDPLEEFVGEMNHTAFELNMLNTSFKNPHGLTEPGHQSTAADLVKLGSAALKLPSFRDYVSTRQRGCALTGAGGYVRNIRWKNTNRLLGIDGYSGMKTGTTDKAGACLISVSRRGNREILLVVLGATSSSGRYVDSRNLFRWLWNQPTGN